VLDFKLISLDEFQKSVLKENMTFLPFMAILPSHATLCNFDS